MNTEIGRERREALRPNNSPANRQLSSLRKKKAPESHWGPGLPRSALFGTSNHLGPTSVPKGVSRGSRSAYSAQPRDLARGWA